MVNSSNFLATNWNTNVSSLCYAVNTQAILMQIWQPVDCKRTFQTAGFVCENKFKDIQNNIRIRALVYCPDEYVYFQKLCVAYVSIDDKLVQHKSWKIPNLALVDTVYLSSWSAQHHKQLKGSKMHLYAGSSQNTSWCYATYDLFFVPLKSWNITKCHRNQTDHGIFTIPSAAVSRECGVLYLSCTDGSCYRRSSHCDGILDCMDHSDEMTCDGMTEDGWRTSCNGEDHGCSMIPYSCDDGQLIQLGELTIT